MDWEKDYKQKFTSAEEAIQVVKAGDYVAFAYGSEPLSLGLALLSRGAEVGNVRIFVPAPGRDFAWYDPGWESIFQIEVAHVLPMIQQMMADKRCDSLVGSISWAHEPGIRRQPDVILTQLSPPDEHGYCSFGASLWNKKQAIREAKVAIAEINENLMRTYGDNFIHVSEIDRFVEHTPSGTAPGATDMLGRKTAGPGERERKIGDNIASLIRDGDCFEVGVGGTAEWLLKLGILDTKKDLGVHSENLPPGIVALIHKGVITGQRKNIHKGKIVSTACGGSNKEDMDFINMNPLFELYSSDYILDPRIIASNDNVVAINSAVTVDLTGQIAAESIGPRMISSTGGQLAFTIGANLSKGGRNITVLTSTTQRDTISRIVPSLESGTIVTVPRTLADIIVTEYGIAQLKGKTQRQRAQELVAITHPSFRDELKGEAERLYYP
ncbi:acetyl-CoA hydrolase/transferase family protein [Chloroflexota bacterium]